MAAEIKPRTKLSVSLIYCTSSRLHINFSIAGLIYFTEVYVRRVHINVGCVTLYFFSEVHDKSYNYHTSNRSVSLPIIDFADVRNLEEDQLSIGSVTNWKISRRERVCTVHCLWEARLTIFARSLVEQAWTLGNFDTMRKSRRMWDSSEPENSGSRGAGKGLHGEAVEKR